MTDDLRRELTVLLESKQINEYMDRVKQYLQRYSDLYGEGSEKDFYFTYMLQTGIELDSPELIEFYVSQGANVNGGRGIIPLKETCLGGICRPVSARKLIELGASVNHEDEGVLQCHALSLAIAKENVEMIELLLDNGAVHDAVDFDMTALDRALKVGNAEIIALLKSRGVKTAAETGYVPPAPLDSTEAVCEAFTERFSEEPIATIQGLMDGELRVDIHIFDEGKEFALCTGGMSDNPLPVEPGHEEVRWPEIVLRLPKSWPIGQDALSDSEKNWPFQWVRRLAMEPHLKKIELSRLFFWPNGSPPQPFAANTEMCYWMLIASIEESIYVSDEKFIGIYTAVPLYKKEYELVQANGLGALGSKFDEHGIGLRDQMIERKNVAV
ncbi:MAG: suppressor of fused domain protein [Planctomycetota bacterium]